MRAMLGLLAVTGLTLGGCQKTSEAGPTMVSSSRGRFVAVGTYAPGQVWAHLARPKPAEAADPAVARLDDDEQIIVVMDSATGELRQCGNLSGHCLAFNPWSKDASNQGAPATLLKHARDLNAEAAVAPDPADSVR